MRKNLVLLGVIAVLVGMASLMFAGTEAGMRVTIPFDFYVNDQLLPAGEYVFNMGIVGPATASCVVVRSKDDTEIRLLTTIPDVNANPTVASLQFNRYGDKHFLTSVAIRSYKATLKMTGLERELIAQFQKEPTALAMVLE